MSRANKKKVGGGRKGCRVIDFEIRLESTWRTNRSVEMSIFVASFYHENCHISKISMDEMRRAARYIDFVYRQSCFCHVSVTRGAVRQIRTNFESHTRQFRNLRQERTTHGHRRLQCALINRNELDVVTINRRRNGSPN